MSKFTPTQQQVDAIEAARTGENLVITAGAGSGKTSTLRLIAEALAPKRGVYIAYNKAIATDAAKSFPANVECRTAHSFAYRAVGYKYKNRLKGGRVTGRQLAAILDIDRSYPLGTGGRELSPARLAGMIMATVNGWCHTALDAGGQSFVKAAGKVVADVPGAEEVSYELTQYIGAQAAIAWQTDLRKESGRLPFSHDMYVKIWALEGAVLPGDFILYDEAQDADPCIAGVVLAQKNAQLIAVGDECQAIYGWRGATDAMKNWPAANRVALTKSFRFGPLVAAEANTFLSLLNAPLRIEGFEKIDSIVDQLNLTDADAVLCRTNAGVIATALNMHYARPFAVVGGTDAIKKFAEAAADLMRGKSAAWHAELGAFKTWDDVTDYVENDEGGSDLRSMVNMIAAFGVETILEVAAKAVPEGTPGALTISTAHKAKGREWPRVLIHSDFTPQTDEETGEMREPSKAELMLMYVSVTRAQTHLDAAALSWAAA